MRVLYFSRSYSPHDHRFLSAALTGGHDVHFLQLEGGAHRTEVRPLPSGVRPVQWEGGRGQFGWRRLPLLVRGFNGVVESIRPDLVHAGPIQSCALIAAVSGFHPLLTMSWGFDLMQDDRRGPVEALATRIVLRRSTYFTSDAQVTRDRAVAYGMPRERTSVIPWGVDLERYAPKNWPRSRPAVFTALCNRAWEPRYGVDVLARAFASAASSRPDIRLILISGGSQARRIRRILDAAGVLERVTFPGQVAQDDLPGWYHQADLFVSPSHVDGASVSLMEAMACGLPVLVSDIPGNKEWVEDHRNGWLFPDGRAQVLSGRLQEAPDHWEQLGDLGRAARITAEARADWRTNARRLMETYDRTAELG